MSFYLRKSVKVGPVRFNLSKSGIGVSTGFKGFRVGTGPRGNYVHMGAGGIYYRKTLSSGRNASGVNPLAGVGGAVPPPVPGIGGGAIPEIPPVKMTEIDSGDVSQMVHSSSAELLQELNTKRALIRWWPGVLVGCCVVFFAMIMAGVLPAFPFLWLLLSVPAVIWTYKRDVLRKTVVLLYDFDPVLEQAYGDLHRAASILGQCQACWHISASGSVQDSRYHAGASNLVDRKETKFRAKSPDFLKTNIETIAVDVGSQTLYFFPDRLLIYDDGRIGAVGYDEINVQVQQKRFVEESTPPSDAHVVDRTWRYVNKNGSPDKRFAERFQLGDNALDDVLTDDSAFQTVTVSRGKTRAGGEAIPQPGEPTVPSFSLDMNRIAALTAETAEVVSILSKALAEESHEEPVEPAAAPVVAASSAQVGIPAWAEALDPRYHAAFLELIALPDGQAPDMTAIAGRHHLMADDLVDGVNAWSDEELGDFLIEVADDDQASIRRELLPTH